LTITGWASSAIFAIKDPNHYARHFARRHGIGAFYPINRCTLNLMVMRRFTIRRVSGYSLLGQVPTGHFPNSFYSFLPSVTTSKYSSKTLTGTSCSCGAPATNSSTTCGSMRRQNQYFVQTTESTADPSGYGLFQLHRGLRWLDLVELNVRPFRQSRPIPKVFDQARCGFRFRSLLD